MTFAEDDLSADKFLCGRLNLLQPRRGYRAATDPVLLAAACPAKAGESVLDMGCGAGAAMLCLAARVANLDLHGLEVQPDYADLARRNAARNGITATVHEGDLTQMPPALRRDFDHVIANPPFYPPGGTPSPVAGRAVAMQVDATPLAIWMQAAQRRLRPGGWLTMIFRTDGLAEVLGALGKLGSVEILPLAPRAGREAGRVILRARKLGRAPLRLLPPFVLHAGAHHSGDREDYTPEAGAVLRGGMALSAGFARR